MRTSLLILLALLSLACPKADPRVDEVPIQDSVGLPEAFADVFRAADPEAVQSCWDHTPPPELEGPGGDTVVTIAPDGRVVHATFEAGAEIAGTPFGECLLKIARGLKFPAAGKTQRMKWPLLLMFGAA